MLGRVHRVFTPWFGHLMHTEYWQRVRVLVLYSLKRSRERGNVIDFQDQGCDRDKGSPWTLFQIRWNETFRGNGKKIPRKHVTTGSGSKSFAIQVVNDWNKPPRVCLGWDQCANSRETRQCMALSVWRGQFVNCAFEILKRKASQ